MKILNKFVCIVLITFLLFCFSIFKVNAETDVIDSINIDVQVSENGEANITETWVCSIYSGTELYKPYYDLYTSEISNLSVTDETGMEYTYISNWNINSSQSDKTGKCGIYISGDETDICWGIGEYGTHTYTISYTISNFVQQYDDYQLINFTLIQDNMDPSPSNVTITIGSDFDFDENTVSVSGYGYSGTAEIEDGKAVFITNGSLGTTGYMNVYISFSNNPFNAEDMTLYNSNESGSTSTNWTSYIPIILIVILLILVVAYFIYSRRNNY